MSHDQPIDIDVFDSLESILSPELLPSSPLSPSSECLSPCISPMNYSHSVTPQHQSKQFFYFIDQTKDIQKPRGPPSPAASAQRRKRGSEPSPDFAAQRRRDPKGQFLTSEIASQLEELETKLKHTESECNSLRQTIQARDVQMDLLRNQLHQLMSEPIGTEFNFAIPYQTVPLNPSEFYPIHTTNRTHILVPSPNPRSQFPMQGEKPFKEKIDYTKIQLRKTDSHLEEEKREVENSEERWKEQQRQQDFIRKLEAASPWLQFPYDGQIRAAPIPYSRSAPQLCSQPQSVPNKLNSQFNKKLDLSSKRKQLGKRERCFDRSSTSPPNGAINIPGSINTRPVPQLSTSPEGKANRQLGGPPSNIYTPPEKIGNLQVPAFTTKINYSDIALKKT